MSSEEHYYHSHIHIPFLYPFQPRWALLPGLAHRGIEKSSGTTWSGHFSLISGAAAGRKACDLTALADLSPEPTIAITGNAVVQHAIWMGWVEDAKRV